MGRKLLYSIVAAVLLLLLGAQGIYYIVFDLAQASCKLNSSKILSDNKQTDVVTLPLKTFSERADKHEIWINGSLYDIGTYQVSGNFVRVNLFHDRGEELLLEDIASLFESSDVRCYDVHGHHISRAYSNGFNDGKVLPLTNTFQSSRSLYVLKDHTDHLCLFVRDIYSGIVTPPPRLIPVC